MIGLAKEGGGNDNITVILAQFGGEGLKPPNTEEAMMNYIQVISRFDPKREATARTQRQVRPATFDDWVAMTVVDYFSQTPDQRNALASLGQYGDYIVFRKGDRLVFQGERPAEANYHYWLVSGKYLLE